MRDRAPAYSDPVLHFDALRLVALREGGRIEETVATENEREMLIRALAHVHSAHAARCRWSTGFSPLPARSANWFDGPCLASCSMYSGSTFLLDLTRYGYLGPGFRLLKYRQSRAMFKRLLVRSGSSPVAVGESLAKFSPREARSALRCRDGSLNKMWNSS